MNCAALLVGFLLQTASPAQAAPPPQPVPAAQQQLAPQFEASSQPQKSDSSSEAAAPQSAAPPVNPKDAEYTRAMAAGLEQYSDGKFDEAARSFEDAARLKPDSDQAQFWAGQALVYGRQPAAAVAYLEAARRAGVDSVGIHLALAQAYAGAGRSADLDRERVLLHQWHNDGKHATLSRENGFLLETFFFRRWHVNVYEYFTPSEAQDTVWKFALRDPAEIIEATYFLSKGEGDRYELTVRHGSGAYVEEKRLHTYSSMPTYQAVKEEVEHKLRFSVPKE